MISDSYEKNSKAYRNLGNRYIENSKNIDLPLLSEFMKILARGGRVLDAGCAGGRDSKKFADAGFLVSGIDSIDIFIDKAKSMVPQADFFVMDLRDMDFKDNFFDGVWAQAVLLHLERQDVAPVLEKFYRMLKKGGKLHVAVKNGCGSGCEADELSGGQKRYFTYFTRPEMELMMVSAGFKIIRSELRCDDVGRKNVEWVIIWGEKN